MKYTLGNCLKRRKCSHTPSLEITTDEVQVSVKISMQGCHSPFSISSSYFSALFLFMSANRKLQNTPLTIHGKSPSCTVAEYHTQQTDALAIQQKIYKGAWYNTWNNHFSTSPFASAGKMGSSNITVSPSADFIPWICFLESNSSLEIPSKHFLRCGWTRRGSFVSDKISNSSSLDRKKNLKQL